MIIIIFAHELIFKLKQEEDDQLKKAEVVLYFFIFHISYI